MDGYRIGNAHPGLNILINNAGSAFVYDVSEGVSYPNAKSEIETNYLSVIHITDQLLPVLQQQESAAIVNVTSIAAFRPMAILPTYAASKAALHFYTDALRQKLKDNKSNIKVFEVMPPIVNTDFSKDIGGEKYGIAPGEVARSLFEAFRKDRYEVPVGATTFVHQKISEALRNIGKHD
ncbi:SDR family NAD(P)-dependent oxidoreductase [Sinomicrobium sp. M5D2P17]